jgi:hypothetical protein
MSSGSGHAKLTERALAELGQEWAVVRQLPSHLIVQGVKGRDNMLHEHVLPSGQKKHFMRSHGNQSHYEAYREGVQYIQEKALEAAQWLVRHFQKQRQHPVKQWLRRAVEETWNTFLRSNPVTGPPKLVIDYFSLNALNALSDALHALQDSFPKGHVTRGPKGKDGSPGPILEVKHYHLLPEALPCSEHKKCDEAYWGGQDFSQEGSFAIDASKDLILLVVDTALCHQQTVPQALDWQSWQQLRRKWLAADEDALKKAPVCATAVPDRRD